MNPSLIIPPRLRIIRVILQVFDVQIHGGTQLLQGLGNIIVSDKLPEMR